MYKNEQNEREIIQWRLLHLKNSPVFKPWLEYQTYLNRTHIIGRVWNSDPHCIFFLRKLNLSFLNKIFKNCFHDNDRCCVMDNNFRASRRTGCRIAIDLSRYSDTNYRRSDTNSLPHDIACNHRRCRNAILVRVTRTGRRLRRCLSECCRSSSSC